MPLFSRADGSKPVEKLSNLRRFMPFVNPRRADAVVFYQRDVPIGETLAWMEAHNAGREKKDQVSFFHLVLTALVRTMAERPWVNRYVKGRTLYQRNKILFSFSVKKQMKDSARLTTVKVHFQPTDTIDDVGRRVNEQIEVGRAKRRTRAENEMRVINRMPNWVTRFMLVGLDLLDTWNLLPASMLDSDPLHTSAQVANLGSIGIDGCFHHMYNYGSNSVMVSLGRISKKPVVNDAGEIVVEDVCDIKFAIDERICDGFYLAKSLERIEYHMSHPSELSEPGPEGVEP